MSSGPGRSLEDEWVDAVVPEQLDWQDLVREHPLLSMGVVAVTGFLIGRFQGDRIVALAKDVVDQKVNQSLRHYQLFVDDRAEGGRGD